MVKEKLWLIAALLTVLGILADMHELRVNRVSDFGRWAWVLSGVLLGPLALALYVPARRVTRRSLVASVWLAVGDASQPVEVRRARLLALKAQGLIGRAVFRACSRDLEQDAAASR
ncbi:Cardiolipin synthase N-terminal domain-containing protein [Pararobbsia alpina]|uniref:hypothetical protein n=1 Tax=Pararobbsia alpina TaxID=621374 RepID=UPI0039A765BA